MKPLRGRHWGILALTLALFLGGCGVPDSGPPVVHGPVDDVLDIGKDDVKPLPRPDADDARDAVRRYFEAASSEWEDLPKQVRQFLVEGTFAPRPSTILVLRDLRFGEPEAANPRKPDVQRVRVSGRVAGGLTQDGMMKPASGAFSHVFEVVSEELEGAPPMARQAIWRVKNPPPQYVLSEEAVEEWYTPVSLYFSDRRSSTTLVPELRYVPNVVWADEPRNLLVDWLLTGPSPWFSPVAIAGFPNGTRRLGNVVRDEKHVVVDLKGVSEQLTKLQFAQLAWTLRLLMPGRQLQVRIEGRTVSYDRQQAHSLDDFQSLNGVPKGADGAVGYYVRNGEVIRLAQEHVPESRVGSDDDTEDDQRPPPVVSAAMSRAGDLAALVRKGGSRWSMWVGRRSGLSRTIRYHEVSGLPPGPIGAPEWAAGIGGAPGSFLVTVDRAVYQVEPGKRAVKVATRSVGGVDKLSVAPDGFRVAVISHGRLYVGGLVQEEDKVRLQKLRAVTDQFRHAADIAWRGEHELVVVDRGLWQVKVDGLEAEKLPSQEKPTSPEQVAAYPTVEGKGRVLVTMDGQLYEVHSQQRIAPANYRFAPVGTSPFFGF